MTGRTQPWYQRVRRWGQTNLVEVDPLRFDVDWWQAQWRRTKTQGILVNCGGIAAYYPTKVPHHTVAPGIDKRDLFGEIVAAARMEGLAVLARMDSNRGDQPVFDARPDWFCFDAEGRPYRRGTKYATCISSTYYDAHIPAILREVVERYAPDGFADNGWAGIERSKICHCPACRDSFREWADAELPVAIDWGLPTYQAWVEWSYARRTALWDANNAVTMAAGGPDCRWVGMLHGQLVHNSQVFQDVAEIAKRTPIILLDHQRRHGEEGFEQNAEVVKRVHGVLGWDKPVAECTAAYDMGYPAFRLSSMPEAELSLWMTEGWAGGADPWWHHIGSVCDDRRQYERTVPLLTWHAEHQDVLSDRTPVAAVGVVWSQRNLDFYGRDDAANRVTFPYSGVNRALVTAGIPFLPIHVDAVSDAPVSVLVLPDIAVLTDEQVAHIRSFLARGGSLLATGDTSLLDGRGRPRGDFALADIFGAHATTEVLGGLDRPSYSIEDWERHSYLRLHREGGAEPLFGGLDATDTISFGGGLRRVTVDEGTKVHATFIPPFPIFPPELAWMPEPSTDIPAIVSRRCEGGGRVLYFAADLDRCAYREEQPDHARLIVNAVRWLLDGRGPITVTCAAPVAVNMYRRGADLVIHLGNLLYSSRLPGRQDRVVPFGPVRLAVAVGEDPVTEVRALVSARSLPFNQDASSVTFEVPTVGVHEVIHVRTAIT